MSVAAAGPPAARPGRGRVAADHSSAFSRESTCCGWTKLASPRCRRSGAARAGCVVRNHRPLAGSQRRRVPGGKTPAPVEALPEMIGKPACMAAVYRMARLVAPRTTPVLITGATGTGKEVVASCDSSAEPARRQALCGDQLRRHSGGAAGVGAVWLCARRFYRSGAIAGGPHSQRPWRERCFWTRSAICRWAFSPSCCAFSIRARCSGWAAPMFFAWTCG